MIIISQVKGGFNDNDVDDVTKEYRQKKISVFSLIF